MLIIGLHDVMCYFPKCVILQGNHHVRGSNIDINKLESKAKVQHFLSQAFKNIYIVIWFCMLLEDVQCKFFLYWHCKHLLINLFLFGDVNNALGLRVNSLQQHIIILRILIVCTLHVKDYPWDRKPNSVH
jgi:hypothetical protein